MLAIADAIEERLQRELQRRPSHIEGTRSGEWVLMDYVDFVVHIFVESKRRFYRLERLWGDAPTVDLAVRDGGRKRTASASLDDGFTLD